MALRGWIVACAVVSAVMLADLGGARLWDRDETRNAQCAVEMYQRGDWIVPTFAGELRTHKPVLLYWMQIASIRVLGISELSLRLPSACCAIGAVALTMLICRRLLGDRYATWTGLALGTSLLFVLSGRAATPDAALIFFSTLAIAIYVLSSHRWVRVEGHESSDRGQLVFQWPSVGQWVLVYAACGIAVLAKGPVGIVLPGCVIGLHCMWQTSQTKKQTADPQASPALQAANSWVITFFRATRRSVRLAIDTAWRMHPLVAVVTVLAIASPWYIAVGLRTDGVWLQEFFWQHNVSRAMNPMEGHSGPPLLYYLGILLVGTFPWSMFAVPVAIATRRAFRHCPEQRPAIMLAVCWLVTYIGFFSLAATKLPSYITPAYPGAAICFGMFAVNIAENYRRNRRWVTAGFAVGLAVGIIVAGVLAGPVDSTFHGAADASFAAIVLAVGSLLGAALLVRQQSQSAITTFAIGGAASIGLIFTMVPRIADSGREDLSLWHEQIQSHTPGEILVLGDVEPSWHFYSQFPIASSVLPMESTWLPKLASHLKQSDRNIAVLRKDRAEQLMDYISINGGSNPPIQVTASANGTLTRQRWVVLQRPSAVANLAQDHSRRWQ